MNINKELQKAFNFYQHGNLNKAHEILTKLVKKYPSHMDVINNLALIKLAQNKPLDAIALFEQSLQNKLQLTTIKNLINLYHQLSNWDKIEELYENNFKKISYDLQIELSYLAAIRENKKTSKVLSKIDSLLTQYPNQIDFYISSIFTLNKLNEYQKALEIGLKGRDLEPENFYISYNLGITYSNLNKPKDSIYYLLQAENQKSNQSLFDLWMTMSAQYIKLNEMNKAREILKKCEKIYGSNTLTRLQNASIESQSGNSKEAESLLKSILKEDPQHVEANYMLGINYLKMNNFKEAFKYYKYRIKRDGSRKVGLFNDLELPEINKKSKVLIAWEQGIGDQLLFFRLMHKFSELVEEITYITQEKLLLVLQNNYPNINFITEKELNIESNKLYKDYIKLNLGSILYYIDDIKLDINDSFLKCDYEKKISYSNKFKSEKKLVGLSWFSSNEEIKDDKSYNLECLYPILKDLSYSFISLQYGDVQKNIQYIHEKYKIKIQYDKELDYFNNIYDLLALISICDEVITCSNITAHLAGSLGIPTSLLLPKAKGKLWYWHESQIKDGRSLWYPSVKVYNQDTQGDWDDVIQKLKDKLK